MASYSPQAATGQGEGGPGGVSEGGKNVAAQAGPEGVQFSDDSGAVYYKVNLLVCYAAGSRKGTESDFYPPVVGDPE